MLAFQIMGEKKNAKLFSYYEEDFLPFICVYNIVSQQLRYSISSQNYRLQKEKSYAPFSVPYCLLGHLSEYIV